MIKKTLIIVIDALGYDLLQKTSFLPNLLNKAVKLIPTYGFGEAAVIWSGELPERTNRWNEFTFNSQLSPFRWTKILPLKFYDTLKEKFPSKTVALFDRVVRRVIEFITAKASLMPCNATYQIPLSKLKYFFPTHDYKTYQFCSLNGHKTIFGIFREQKVKYCYIGYPKVRADYDVYEKSREALKENEVTISFFSELDSIEHWNGKESIEVNKKLDNLSEFVNNIVRIFKQNKKLFLVLVC